MLNPKPNANQTIAAIHLAKIVENSDEMMVEQSVVIGSFERLRFRIAPLFRKFRLNIWPISNPTNNTKMTIFASLIYAQFK